MTSLILINGFESRGRETRQNSLPHVLWMLLSTRPHKVAEKSGGIALEGERQDDTGQRADGGNLQNISKILSTTMGDPWKNSALVIVEKMTVTTLENSPTNFLAALRIGAPEAVGASLKAGTTSSDTRCPNEAFETTNWAKPWTAFLVKPDAIRLS